MSAPHPLVRRVGHWLRRMDISPGGMVVGVSGGPDSVALLLSLASLRRDDRLIIAHLNHKLRGSESDVDEDFVRQLHSRLQAEGSVNTLLYCSHIDVAEQARRLRGNLEAVARGIRYHWFTQLAAETGARWVATGHTADDQAETVLHRLLRGAGLKGLRGIAARRPLAGGVELIRPLLGLGRSDVLSYLKAVNQPDRQDSSNRDPRFVRNRIRHELLPLLTERFNPAIVRILGRLARQAETVYQGQKRQARALLVSAERPRAGRTFVFDRAALAAAPRELVGEAFRLIWEQEGWPAARLGFDAWDRLAGVACGEIGGVDLPGGIRVRGRGRVVLIEPPE